MTSVKSCSVCLSDFYINVDIFKKICIEYNIFDASSDEFINMCINYYEKLGESTCLKCRFKNARMYKTGPCFRCICYGFNFMGDKKGTCFGCAN